MRTDHYDSAYKIFESETRRLQIAAERTGRLDEIVFLAEQLYLGAEHDKPDVLIEDIVNEVAALNKIFLRVYSAWRAITEESLPTVRHHKSSNESLRKTISAQLKSWQSSLESLTYEMPDWAMIVTENFRHLAHQSKSYSDVYAIFDKNLRYAKKMHVLRSKYEVLRPVR